MEKIKTLTISGGFKKDHAHPKLAKRLKKNYLMYIKKKLRGSFFKKSNKILQNQ